MNENINLVEILKDCPKGTKLYSPIFGEVKFFGIDDNEIQPVLVLEKSGLIRTFDATGKYYYKYDEAECLLFPSKDQRGWTKFKCSKPKFNPNTLQPFDKILVRNNSFSNWTCNMFSHYKPNEEFLVNATFNVFKYCVPYNDDTKHLVGTSEEAPENYRYWED